MAKAPADLKLLGGGAHAPPPRLVGIVIEQVPLLVIPSNLPVHSRFASHRSFLKACVSVSRICVGTRAKLARRTKRGRPMIGSPSISAVAGPRFKRNRHAWVRAGRQCVDFAPMPREQRMPERWRYSIVVAVGFLRFTGFEPTRPVSRNSRLRPI